MAKKIWIPQAIHSKSELRKSLHVPTGQAIPEHTLNEIKRKQPGEHVMSHGKSVAITPKLKKRATLAKTLRDMQKKQRR